MIIIKKIISSFLMPLPLSLLISLVGLILLWFTKRQRTGKIIVTGGLFLMLLLSSNLISDQLLRPLESKYNPDNIQLSNKSFSLQDRYPIKFVAVLGGGHTTNPKLPITCQISEASLVSLIEGVRIYRKYSNVKLILSGGSIFDSITTADIMTNIAKELGVDDNDIIIESKSKDTEDEARFIKAIVGNDQFILVTSASHMPRSIAMFKKLGMNPIPAPTGQRVIKQYLSLYSFYPRANNILKSEYAFHEYIGIVWAKIRGQV